MFTHTGNFSTVTCTPTIKTTTQGHSNSKFDLLKVQLQPAESSKLWRATLYNVRFIKNLTI